MKKKEYQLDFIIQKERKEEKVHVVLYAWEGEEYSLSPSKTLCSLNIDETSKVWEDLEEDNCDSYEDLDFPDCFNESFRNRSSEYLFNRDFPSLNTKPDLLEEVKGMAEEMADNAILLRFEDDFDICRDCMSALMEKGFKTLLKLISNQR